MLIDYGGALLPARVGRNQVALDGGGRQALVPERDRQFGAPGQVARECACRLRARPFAAVHVDRQPEYKADRAPLGRERQQASNIGRERRAADGLDAGRESAVGIAAGNADGLGAEIEADERAARRPMGGGLDQRQDRAAMPRTLRASSGKSEHPFNLP